MGKRKARGTTSRRRRGEGGSKPPLREEVEKEGDYCFVCKDGGLLLLCDYRNCGKAYHPGCVGKDDDSVNSDEEFICSWHTCFICNGRSYYRCFCCPSNSVCRGCLGQTDFVQLNKKTKGFCTNCLRMVIMIEKNVEVDSDGEWVDFSDKETYEFLFKEYWEIINEREGLTLDNLQEAYAHIKMSPNCNRVSDSENRPKEQHGSDDDFLGNGDDDDDEPSGQFNVNEISNKVKSFLKQGKSKKNVYVGWGSKELIGFLSSIGKDTSKFLDQFGAAEVVKEYIRQKDLLPKEKKKHVICDDKLWTLFRKSKLKYNKIYSLLERHIAANNTSEDETLASSEDNSDSISVMKKKTRTMTSEPSTLKGISERNKRCFASLVHDNIKLIYLKRSLIMDLLKLPETFENKVIGCFVRVKKDPEDYRYHKPRLGQVTGIRKSTEEYKIRDISTDILLCISSIQSEVKISMLSEEDFEEDECEDLRLLVQKENSKRHTVAELEEKVRSVHVDIVNHWISNELKRLDKLIEMANEKGWRNEMHEYIDKRQLLCTPSERQRLVEEVPEVIPDTEDNEDTKSIAAASCKSFQKNTNALQGVNEERVVSLKSCSEKRSKATEADADGDTPGTRVQKQGTAVPAHSPIQATCLSSFMFNEADIKANAAGETARTHVRNQGTRGSKDNAAGDKPGMHVQKQGAKDDVTTEVINIDDDEDGSVHDEGGDITANLDPDESGDTHVVQHETNHTSMWYYFDPQGDEQGPFSIELLRSWKEAGPYFNDDFKVWRAGQSSDSAILLTDAMRLAQ